MPKNWIAFSTGANGGVSGSQNSGFVATQAEAEAWAKKTLGNGNISCVIVAKAHSMAKRTEPAVEFSGISDVAEVQSEAA